MLNAGVLSFREFVMHEPLPLATLHEAVLQFLRGRADIAVFGAHAVNAYTSEPRMTQDVDVMALHAAGLAEELRNHLTQKFHIAVRVREVAEGKGFRLYQVQKTGNRHLVDVRAIKQVPVTRTFEEINILAPTELIASKVVSYQARRGKPKSGTDWRDLAMLLLAFPELKSEAGPVYDLLCSLGVSAVVLEVWRELALTELQNVAEDDDLAW